MFDIAFSELLVIVLVALVVIGPEKLPKVARTMGLLAGRLQRYVSTVKADVERELHMRDIENLPHEIGQGLRSAEDAVTQQVRQVEQAMNAAMDPELPRPKSGISPDDVRSS